MNLQVPGHSSIRTSLFTCVLCFALAACGGGGGGGSSTSGNSTSSIPPPPTNAASLSVLAGTGGGIATTDGTGSSARFSFPTGIAIDPSGNLYVTQTRTYVIRKITPDGAVTTFAGSVGVSGSANGPGQAATFANPTGIACDAAGNVYVADGQLLRKITPAGLVSTLAGGTSGIADGTGSAAQFSNLGALTIDGGGNLYATDESPNEDQIIRKISPAGVVTTLAPTVERFGIGAFVADQAGDLYVASSDHNIRYVTTAGVASVLAAYPGSNPAGIAIGAGGNLFVTDVTDNVVRMVTTAGVVTTLAGTVGYAGNVDGTGAAARFNSPMGIAADTMGNLYVADWMNCTIRKIAPGGVVTTFAGEGPSIGYLDGAGTAAQFNEPYGIAAGPGGNLYVADEGNGAIRLVTPAGVVSTLVSAAALGTNAAFSAPAAIAVDASGNAFFVDAGARSIFKLDTSGNVALVAGNNQNFTSTDGTGATASFSDPNGIAVDAMGNLYVTDLQFVPPHTYHPPLVGSTIRKITPAGVVTTIAGSTSAIGSTDGVGSAALFINPAGVLADSTGNLYVADRGNCSIRKLSPTSGSSGSSYTVTTFAGVSGQCGEVDGLTPVARLDQPNAIAMDSMGNFYVLDGTSIIRKIAPNATTTTIWGNENLLGFQINSQPGTLFGGYGIALIDDHNLAISTTSNILDLTLP